MVLVFLEGNAWGENTLSEIIEEFVRVADSMGGLLVKISIYQPLTYNGGAVQFNPRTLTCGFQLVELSFSSVFLEGLEMRVIDLDSQVTILSGQGPKPKRNWLIGPSRHACKY